MAATSAHVTDRRNQVAAAAVCRSFTGIYFYRTHFTIEYSVTNQQTNPTCFFYMQVKGDWVYYRAEP